VIRPRTLGVVALSVFGVWLWLAPAPARAVNTLETVEQTGASDNRIDLVIMAEGYRATEAAAFRDHVDNLLSGLFAMEPWASYRGAFNLYRIVTESAESGADHPSQGIEVDTYLDATYDFLGVERLLVVNEAQAVSVATDLLPEVDLVVVLVNDTLYGGSGGSVATVSATDVSVFILTHELGHSFAGLADEYTDALPGIPPGDGEPNVDFDFAFDQLKWNAWVEPTTPLPTLMTDAVTDHLPLGAYEGARYLETGIYRPAPMCMMRSVSYGYCAVCAEALVLSVYDRVDPIDAVSPPESPPETPVTLDRADPATYPVPFEVTTVLFGGDAAPSPTVTWWLGDREVGSGTALSVDLAMVGPDNGTHELRCEVTDDGTWVRTDPDNTLASARSWTVLVTGESPDAGVDAGPDPDGGSEPSTDPRGCACGTTGPPSASGLALVLVLLLILLLVNRRRHRTVRFAPSR
jgi:MYXO-CTERM domain-containing protein